MIIYSNHIILQLNRNKVSLIPEMLIRNDIKIATVSYIETKIAKNFNLDIDLASELELDTLMSIYKSAISGYITNSLFLEQINNNDSIGLLDGIQYNDERKEDKWYELSKSAKSGDILLFMNLDSDEVYGYFNHAALVLNVTPELAEIHVLHARNQELGVEADLPMDKLNYAMLNKNNYWRKYDVVILFSVDGVTEDVGFSITNQATEKFKSYAFGFRGFKWIKETTCVEIIRDSLKLEGIEIISDFDYISILKKAFDGKMMSVVLIPDDILLSDNVTITGF